jgi:uncharacterized protein YggT (Ycf19 family)
MLAEGETCMEATQTPVAGDNARRISQHEAVKAKVERDVHSKIAQESTPRDGEDRAEVKAVAADLRHRAVNEVAESEGELQRARKATRTSQFVDYAFYVVYGLIGLEIALEFLAARQSSGFKQFLDAITMPFLAPFKGLMPDPSLGSMQLMMSYVMALIVYALLHMAVNGMLRLFAEKKAAI